MTSHWPFEDPPNTAALTTKEVLEHGQPIVYVSHDEDDGGFQFLGPNGASRDPKDARVVGLRTILAHDGSLAEVADLPLGWFATRRKRGSAWKRFQRDPRTELLELLRHARELLARPGNDFTWSSWKTPEAALLEIDTVLTAMDAGRVPECDLVRLWFLPTGPIQEVSVNSGWGDEFIDLADRVDDVLQRAYP